MSLTNPQQPAQEPKGTSALKTASRYATVGVIGVALRLAWIFYSRHASDEAAARALAASQQAQRESEAKRIFGEGEVKIISYSIDKASMARGEEADLCYGVLNVTKVVIEPHVEDSKPSAFHCLTVSPHTTTTYTITASNDHGDSKTRAVTVRVH